MFFYSRTEYDSEKNGKIIVEKSLWFTSIIVNGCLEAGAYLIDMWENALKKLPKQAVPKNVLILGLGGGNVIRILQRKFPGANITVVEWDDVMIAIAKKLKLFNLTPRIKISNKDAREVLETMSEKFDLIIVDLFRGPIPPEFLGEEKTVEQLKKLLKDGGYLFVNVYRHTQYLQHFQSGFTEEKIWKFRLNHLGLFSNEKKVPKDFVDIRQSEKYLKGLFRNGALIKSGNSLGVRHNKGVFAIEYYTGDEEPHLLPWTGFRMAIWDRVHPTSPSAGWFHMLPGVSLSTVVISDIREKEYWKIWSETARRYRTQWETQEEYEITNIDLPAFISHYRVLGRPKDTREIIIKALQHRAAVSGEMLEIFALKKKGEDNLVGSMVIFYAPEIAHSYYLFAFLDKQNAPPQAGVWLISEWMRRSKEKGIRFANFGPVWTPGAQKSWKGFTEFKAHFKPFSLTYQRPLFKFTFSPRDSTEGEQTNEIGQR